MEKVKMFYGFGGASLREMEKEINKWLSEQNIEITRVLQTESVYPHNSNDHVNITIFYKEKKKKG